jgi:hypothetical protein
METAGIIAVMLLAIPVVAIVGGITAGIMKTRGHQRLIELARRERIAAIEKGLDPAKLPPLPVMGNDDAANYLSGMLRAEAALSPRQRGLRQAQGFLVTGLILLGSGVGLSLMLAILPEANENNAWAVGLLPTFIGLALLVCSAVVRRDALANNDGGPGPNA